MDKRNPTSFYSMRDRVQVQARTTPVSPNGEKTEAWTTTATAWACVQEESGSELVGQRQVQGETVVTVTMRWRSDVGEKSRFLFGAQILEVFSAVNPDGRRRFLVCSCRRRDA